MDSKIEAEVNKIDSYDFGPRQTSPGERIARLERAVSLLARHVGATGWNKPLQDVLDEIDRDFGHHKSQ